MFGNRIGFLAAAMTDVIFEEAALDHGRAFWTEPTALRYSAPNSDAALATSTLALVLAKQEQRIAFPQPCVARGFVIAAAAS